MGQIILSVEDDDGVYRILEIAFRELNLDVALYRAIDGLEALSFLRRMRRARTSSC